MSITFVLDATHANLPSVRFPAGTLAGLYTTGSPDIKATESDFAAHPNCVRICQDNGSDDTADILDSELGAATAEDCAIWIPKARASFESHKRPGQRWPGIYASKSALTPIANALVAAKLTNVPLSVAEWGLAEGTAISDIVNATQPFPIIAMQIINQGIDDFSVYSTQWLTTVSGMAPPPQTKPEMPPGQWNDPNHWKWQEAMTVGIGLDGNLHVFNFTKNSWNQLA